MPNHFKMHRRWCPRVATHATHAQKMLPHGSPMNAKICQNAKKIVSQRRRLLKQMHKRCSHTCKKHIEMNGNITLPFARGTSPQANAKKYIQTKRDRQIKIQRANRFSTIRNDVFTYAKQSGRHPRFSGQTIMTKTPPHLGRLVAAWASGLAGLAGLASELAGLLAGWLAGLAGLAGRLEVVVCGQVSNKH